MITWTREELEKIGTAEELKIASLRQDGTLRKPVIIWVVCVGDDLYVRSVKGSAGLWFRGTQVRHAGHIWAGGVDKDVTFVDVSDPAINAQVDTAYLTKYGRYPQYVAPMVVPASQATTIKLVPRPTE
ncbi:MAG: hypothetical protein A2Z49_05070 [Chloroflexi bacterium RBG_19FT_COMBO_56_12]|nr:MAG: hypothetical protein A2Z49_05070 [Chloroflexi bacterium RBG_19FT_COMBO_56_12]